MKNLIRSIGLCVFGLVMLVLASACAGVTQSPDGTVNSVTLVGKVQSVNVSKHSVTLNINGIGVPVSGLTDQQITALQRKVGITYSIKATRNPDGSYSIASGSDPQVDVTSTSVVEQTQQSGKTNSPYSPYVLVSPASGLCHSGGIVVQPGASFTAEANGQSFPVHIDNVTVTFPTLPDHTSAVIHVPAQTDLSLKECDGSIDVSGIGGQMDLSATNGNINATGVRLFGNSHLHIVNSSISFNGSLDRYSNSLFDANSGNISVKLPKSDPFHIDSLTLKEGNISTNLGTPTPYGSSGSQLHVSSQPAPGAQLAVNMNSNSMDFNIV